MYSTIAIKKEVKDRAAIVAKKKHLSLSALANILFDEFSCGRIQISVREFDENGFSPELVKEILEAKNNPNLSPPFDNMEDAIAFLDKDEDNFSKEILEKLPKTFSRE